MSGSKTGTDGKKDMQTNNGRVGRQKDWLTVGWADKAGRGMGGQRDGRTERWAYRRISGQKD